jgi:hypothetical protein
MCEAEAGIGARSDVLPEVKAAPGSAPCFGYCSYPVAPPVAEQALRPPCLRRKSECYTPERMYTPRLNLLHSGKWGVVRRPAFQVIMPRPPA